MTAEAALGSEAQHASARAMTDRERIQAAIDRLKPSERDVLSLVLWEQLSYSDAATVLGCSVNAVGLRLHKAKAALRRELELGQGDPSIAPTTEADSERRRGFRDEA
jgi:RNA polymerase sigma-70 factor (ECF subfamily)